MLTKNINKITLLKLSIIVIAIVAIAVFLCTRESPDYEYLYLLGGIRDCVWHGFEGYEILRDQEKAKVKLPKSLMELTPLFLRVELKEFDNYTDNCRLVYNPTGYKNSTWIAIYFNGNSGDYVLWSNKEIKPERDVLKNALKTDGLKYYSVKRLPNISD